MNPQIASILRMALILLSGYLIDKGVIGAEQQDAFTSTALTLVGAGLGLATIVSHVRADSRAGQLLRLALSLPSNSTVNDLVEAQSVMKYEGTVQGQAALASTGASGWKDFLTRQAISTVAAIAADRDSRGRFARYLLPLRDALNMAFPVE